ncbi:MAG TPA: hypothetical protein VMU81_31055 [Acetobacteraceae bacterium]|nr:hypothetical protein [Acetobacteraceae bacterium]
MSVSVVSFVRRALNSDWSAQELAEFYRVEAALLQAGMRVASDRGVTDEGDPWFVFCRAEDDEVIIHFARIRGQYLICAPSYGTHATGRDFRALVRDLVERHKALQPVRRSADVLFHPSSLLVVLVASALFKAGYARAAEVAPATRTAPAAAGPGQAESQPPRTSLAQLEHALDIIARDFPQTAAALSAATFANVPSPGPVPTVVVTAHVAYTPPASHGPPILAQGSADHVVTPLEGAGSVTPSPLLAVNTTPLPGHSAHDLDPVAIGVSTPLTEGSGPAAGAPLTHPLSLLTVPVLHAVDVVVSNESAVSAVPTALANVNDLATTVLHDLGAGEPILYLNSVPEAFNMPLHQSLQVDHASEADQTAGAPLLHTSAAVVAPTEAASVVALSTTTESVASTPSDTASTGLSSASAAAADMAQGPAAMPASEAPPANGLSLSDLGTVLNLVQTFSQEVGSHLAVVVTPTQVVAYDAYAIDHSPAAVSAVTYDFVDGSSVSLVGLPTELPHIHL